MKLGVLMDYLLAIRLIALPRSAQVPDMLTSPASDRDLRTGIVCGEVVTSKRQLLGVAQAAEMITRSSISAGWYRAPGWPREATAATTHGRNRCEQEKREHQD